MKKIRIGNDITLRWRVFVNNGETELQDCKGVKVVLSNSVGNAVDISAISIEGSIITMKLYGYKMLGSCGESKWKLGAYKLTLYINHNDKGQAVADCCNAFELVGSSCSAGGDGQDIETSVMDITTTDITVGMRGDDGKSAYQIAVGKGFEGTEEEWLESLHGENGKSAYDEWLALGNIGTVEDFLNINKGKDGDDGKSAYQIAVENGFEGTEEEWIASLKGKDFDINELPQEQLDMLVDKVAEKFAERLNAIDEKLDAIMKAVGANTAKIENGDIPKVTSQDINSLFTEE